MEITVPNIKLIVRFDKKIDEMQRPSHIISLINNFIEGLLHGCLKC